MTARRKRAAGAGKNPNPVRIELYRPGTANVSPGAAREPDPGWRRWFIEVEQRRRDIDRMKNGAPAAFSRGGGGRGTRRSHNRGQPRRAGFFVEKDASGAMAGLAASLEKAARHWKTTVGEEIAAETSVYSLKNGVLTIEVTSSTLFFEMKQMHWAPCLRDLRDIWDMHPPLVDLKFRLGANGPASPP